MKGGKGGRPRRASGTRAKPASGKRSAKSATVVRPPSTAPKKGARRKTFGGRSTAEDE